jgi:5-methylcytosine-specific restriction endonuclease McrA
MMIDEPNSFRTCLREPIPEIADAARYLDTAVTAHLTGDSDLAATLIRLADMPAIREWTESLWGKNSPFVKIVKPSDVTHTHPTPRKRQPTAIEKALLHQRDGYNCRFCGIPLIRADVRRRIRSVYPQALSWGNRNTECHAAFQAMWAQYDHVMPFTRGGLTDFDNLVITCAPCNFGRMDSTVDEVGLLDPRKRPPVRSAWDGLERFQVRTKVSGELSRD